MADIGPISSRLTELQHSWEKDPGSRVYLQLADEYRKLARHPEAIDVLKKGLALRPNDLSGLVSLGRCHFELGELDAAAEALESVITRDPAHIVANKLLLEIYLQAGNAAKAGERLDLYKLLNETDPDLGSLEAWLKSLRSGAGASQPAAAPAPAEPAPDPAAFETLQAAEIQEAIAPEPVATPLAVAPLQEEPLLVVSQEDAVESVDVTAPSAVEEPGAAEVAFELEEAPVPEESVLELAEEPLPAAPWTEEPVFDLDAAPAEEVTLDEPPLVEPSALMDEPVFEMEASPEDAAADEALSMPEEPVFDLETAPAAPDEPVFDLETAPADVEEEPVFGLEAPPETSDEDDASFTVDEPAFELEEPSPADEPAFEAAPPPSGEPDVWATVEAAPEPAPPSGEPPAAAGSDDIFDLGPPPPLESSEDDIFGLDLGLAAPLAGPSDGMLDDLWAMSGAAPEPEAGPPEAVLSDEEPVSLPPEPPPEPEPPAWEAEEAEGALEPAPEEALDFAAEPPEAEPFPEAAFEAQPEEALPAAAEPFAAEPFEALPEEAEEALPAPEAVAEPPEPAAAQPPADESDSFTEPATATLGELYFKQGHYDEAEKIFRLVLRHEPNNAAALRGLQQLRFKFPGAVTAERLLDGTGVEGRIPEGLTAKKVIVLGRYLDHLRKPTGGAHVR